MSNIRLMRVIVLGATLWLFATSGWAQADRDIDAISAASSGATDGVSAFGAG